MEDRPMMNSAAGVLVFWGVGMGMLAAIAFLGLV
jgi:hypothetical protein